MKPLPFIHEFMRLDVSGAVGAISLTLSAFWADQVTLGVLSAYSMAVDEGMVMMVNRSMARYLP